MIVRGWTIASLVFIIILIRAYSLGRPRIVYTVTKRFLSLNVIVILIGSRASERSHTQRILSIEYTRFKYV
uniref:Secreted protein n=1 Tax=Trichogramma kaykai TaxID=54128 RepID=A0ABD2WCX0_9HYME